MKNYKCMKSKLFFTATNVLDSFLRKELIIILLILYLGLK